jgi:hypothetical protein
MTLKENCRKTTTISLAVVNKKQPNVFVACTGIPNWDTQLFTKIVLRIADAQNSFHLRFITTPHVHVERAIVSLVSV